MDKSVNLFISYAHEDEQMKRELEKHLIVLKRSGQINIWSDRQIIAGQSWDETIMEQLEQADIILTLISANFLASDYLWEKELNIALERYSANLTIVIPIILSPCAWTHTPFAKFQVLPSNGEPITNSKNKDQVYSEIVRHIENLISNRVFNEQPRWLKLIEDEMKIRAGKLNLSNCNLSVIPEQLIEMPWLISLNLSSNQITDTNVFNNFEPTHQLQDLNLSTNKIRKIEGLNGFKKLENLNLFNNLITEIDALDELTELKMLTLSSNQISKLKGLDKLNKLDILVISANQITKIEGIEKIPALKKLDLSFNKISKIEGFEVTTLPEQFELEELNLASNQIIKIEGLNNLKKLNSLDLSSNQIIEIEGLNGLDKLNTLNLSSNQVTTIEGLNDLKNLSVLSLNFNRITKIEGLDNLPSSLQTLMLFGNSVTDINQTVFGTSSTYNCINDLKTFFAENLVKEVPEVKLILTGNSDVGKTKFREYLTTGKYVNTRNSTHGLEVHPYKLKETIKKQYDFNDDTKINIWDFGGQEYFHNTHQLFFNQHAVYIFLWEKETNKNEPILTEVKRDEQGAGVYRVLEHFDVKYWLSNIRHFASDATIILVQNKVDMYEQKKEPLEWLPYDCLKQFNCNNQYHISIVKSADKNLDYWYDFEKLKHAIFSELKTFVSQNKEGNIYNKVRHKIEELKSVNYWKVPDFIAFIDTLKTSSASANANSIDNRLVIQHFCRQGKVLYPFDEELQTDKVIFTNPQWLSEKMYEILNDEVLQRNGFFEEQDLKKLVNEKKIENEQILGQIIDLMTQYNIIFFNPNKKQYVAPQYLPEVPTVHYSQVKKLLLIPKLIIKIDGFIPKSVINNIIARYAINDDAANFYKYGVKTESQNKDILLIEVDYPQKKIYVYTESKEASYLRDVFTDILSEFDIKLKKDTAPNTLTESEIISSGTKIFISIDDKIFVDWVELWNSHRTGDVSTVKDYCVAEDGNMVLKKMFAPYYLSYNDVKNIKTNEGSKPKKIFISYSSKNTDFMRRFETHLEPLKRNGTIELWHDRMIEPGTKWDDSIKTELRSSDLIVFLLSPDFIATNYIFEFEIPQAIKQMESNNSKLFFVELQSCSWHRTVLSRFQQTTDPTADNKGVIVIKEALNDEQWKKVIDQLEKKMA